MERADPNEAEQEPARDQALRRAGSEREALRERIRESLLRCPESELPSRR